VIGVRKAPMVLLVTDIINFSGLSERLGEERVAQILNVWYDDCRAIMEENEGTIDKFMGDGMFGYWTKTTPQARFQALEAAKLLAEGPRTLPSELRQFLEFEQISVRCGVGIHIGEAAVGAVARGTRTALGDAVNMTFRIESLTRELATPILTSSTFLSGWDPGSTQFESFGFQELKGYTEQMELFGLADES
ncbi:MAG: adenylate/guanylate cyclase domain-containing protein, partial [Verrucomicrobiota bacterium]